MTKEQILNDLKEIMKPYTENEAIIDTLEMDTVIMEKMPVDSVDLVEIVLDIEEKYSIQIEDNIVPELKTPAKIVEVIMGKIA